MFLIYELFSRFLRHVLPGDKISVSIRVVQNLFYCWKYNSRLNSFNSLTLQWLIMNGIVDNNVGMSVVCVS